MFGAEKSISILSMKEQSLKQQTKKGLRNHRSTNKKM